MTGHGSMGDAFKGAINGVTSFFGGGGGSSKGFEGPMYNKNYSGF